MGKDGDVDERRISAACQSAWAGWSGGIMEDDAMIWEVPFGAGGIVCWVRVLESS